MAEQFRNILVEVVTNGAVSVVQGDTVNAVQPENIAEQSVITLRSNAGALTNDVQPVNMPLTVFVAPTPKVPITKLGTVFRLVQFKNICDVVIHLRKS